MILITGGSGQLGTALRQLLPAAHAPGRDELDLTDTDRIGDLVAAARPDLVLNCAAYTAVDRAEDEPELAHLINAAAPGELARCCAGLGIPLVTFSTDYVFDGAASRPYLESSPVNPINTYGASKARGESAVLAAHPAALVIRTSWVFSGTHPNFVTSIVGRARTEPVRVVADQTGCPTYAPHLAAATLEAVSRGATGILHLTNTGATTWFDLARHACAIAGVDPERVAPITTEEYPTRARRPGYSVLGSERLGPLGLAPLPVWSDGVRAALAAGSPAPPG